MIIKKKDLVRYLELVALKGDIENKEVLLNIEPNTISSIIGHSSKTLAISAILNGVFDNVGQVGLDNIPLTLSLLKSFPTNEITITKEQNKLILLSNDNKLNVKLILREPEYIINTLESKKIKLLVDKAKGNEFILSIDKVKQIISYINALGSEKIILRNRGKKELVVALENKENEILASFDLEQEVKPFSVKLMKQITSILNIVNSDIELSLQDDSPISIKVKDENIEVIYIVAPIKQ